MKSSQLSEGSENVVGIEMGEPMKYICDICKSYFSDQFKFFEHLKAHYEAPSEISPSTSLTASESVQRPSISEGQINNVNSNNLMHVTVSGNNNFEDNFGTPYHDVPIKTDPIKLEHHTNTKALLISNNDLITASEKSCVLENNVDEIDDVSTEKNLNCPKCNRTFRREKTFKTHVSNCQKGDDEQELHKGDKVNKKANKDRFDVVMLSQDESMSGSFVDESEEVSTMNVDNDPLRSSDVDFDEEDEDLLDENVCPSCDEMFPSRPKLGAHIKKLHPDLVLLFSSSEKPIKKKKTPATRKQEVLKCTECQRIFNHRNSLVYHMRSHTGERPHQCEQCGKSFFATSALKVHMRLHSGEKPYKCDHCGRHFRQWGDLKYHVISIHSDIRQYQCEFCGKDFARKYSLVVHRRIHTGERNYKCDFCDKCFRAASYLQNHRRIHTGEKPHSCNICGKPFRVRSDMKRHMASHNRDQNNPTPQASSIPASSSTQPSSINVQHASVVSTQSGPSSTNQLLTTSMPQQLIQSVRGINQTGQNVNSTSELVQYEVQQVAMDDSNEAVISGDLNDGTPINITLSQDAPGGDGGTLSVAAVATLQDLPEGVIYQNRDGQMEAVTIRESSTGTIYVATWPVFMN